MIKYLPYQNPLFTVQSCATAISGRLNVFLQRKCFLGNHHSIPLFFIEIHIEIQAIIGKKYCLLPKRLDYFIISDLCCKNHADTALPGHCSRQTA